MPIVNYKTYINMLETANKNKYAYPAINVSSMETANAALVGFAEAVNLRLHRGTRQCGNSLLPFCCTRGFKLWQFRGGDHQFPDTCDDDEFQRGFWLRRFVEFGQLNVPPLGRRCIAC